MTVEERNAIMEAKGTPKVWVVEIGIPCSGQIYTSLYHTEEEALEEFNSTCKQFYRKIYRTWDIWGWTERNVIKKAQ